MEREILYLFIIHLKGKPKGKLVLDYPNEFSIEPSYERHGGDLVRETEIKYIEKNWNEFISPMKRDNIKLVSRRNIVQQPQPYSWNETIIPENKIVFEIRPLPKEDYEMENFAINILGTIPILEAEQCEELTIRNRPKPNRFVRNKKIRETILTIIKKRPPDKKLLYISREKGQRVSYIGRRKNWNDYNKAQRNVKLFVVGEKRPWELDVASGDEICINREPSDDEVIENNDDNYKDNEKEQNYRRTVKATIRKIHNEYDSDELDDIDPLCGVRKHTNKHYDKYFKTNYMASRSYNVNIRQSQQEAQRVNAYSNLEK